MKEKLFVLSIDAMVHEDIAYMQTKPNFSKLMKKRAEVEQVYSIYPSITYPAHVSLITGCRPGKHGVINNTPLKPYSDKITHFHRNYKNLLVEDLFSAAKRAGYSTASVYWPITANNPNIDYNINEYFFYYPNEDIEEAFAGMGANEAALRAIRENTNRFPATKNSGKINLPSTFDDFIVGCVCSLIRNEKPDMMMSHICYVDSNRHRYGTFSNQVREALDQTDIWLGEIIKVMEDAGVYDNTNFVILSDHGQRDFKRYVKLNVLLARGGFIELGADGTIYDWKAFSKSNGMSVTVHLQDYTNSNLRQQVYEYLKELAADGCWGFETVYTADELREKYGTYGPFDFIIEADDETVFAEGWNGPVTYMVKDEQNPRYRAKHGYEPEKGPKPVFMGHGPAFKDGAVIPTAQLIDVAPTLAAILGQDLPQAEGHCLKELLR